MRKKIIITTSIIVVILIPVLLYLQSIDFFTERDHCTDFDKIVEYNTELQNRISTPPFGLRSFPSRFTVSWRTIEEIQQENGKYVLAVFGTRNGILTVNILGSNDAGDQVSSTRPNNYPEIKASETELKNNLRTRDIRNEIDVRDFPLIIKMDTRDFVRLRESTTCPAFLCYIGIEPSGWFKSSKVTIGIAASDSTGTRPNVAYRSGNLCAFETWPSRNFTLAQHSDNGDIDLP